MEKVNMKTYEKPDEEMAKIIDAFRAITVNVLMNSYAEEYVTLGLLRPNDTIPFDRFVEELSIQRFNPYGCRDFIAGHAITSEGTIVDKEWDSFARENFALRMNALFDTAPHKKDYDDNGLLLFKNGLGEYILSLYPLYTQIMKTEVEYGLFDLMSDFADKAQEGENFFKVAKFLTAIWVKRLRQGSCVERYVKEIQHLPYFVKRLLKIHKNRHLLANSNTDGLDYKIAVLTTTLFMYPEHTKLFELKAKKFLENRA